MKRILFCLFLLMSFSTIYATNYNYTIDCITDSNGNIVKRDDPISSSTVYKITQKVFKNIDENSNTTFCIGKLIKKESAISTIPTTTNYIGYYADIDGDGTVDGVIFADLAFSKSGVWNLYTSEYNDAGTYSYSAQTNLKQYYVSQKSYTDKFGTKPVISPVSGTTGNDRFYVMALSDINSSSLYWYYSAYSTKISDYNTITSQDFGSGKQNTANMITAWNASKYGKQDELDIWGQIQRQDLYKISEGWFVPSSKEWAAFGSTFSITKNNRSSFGLSTYCLSSSLEDSKNDYDANFSSCHIGYNSVKGSDNHYYSARLATTY